MEATGKLRVRVSREGLPGQFLISRGALHSALTPFDATVLRVFDDEGRVGIGSDDLMLGFASHEDLFVGWNLRQLERHCEVLSISSSITAAVGRWTLRSGIWRAKLWADAFSRQGNLTRLMPPR